MHLVSITARPPVRASQQVQPTLGTGPCRPVLILDLITRLPRSAPDLLLSSLRPFLIAALSRWDKRASKRQVSEAAQKLEPQMFKALWSVLLNACTLSTTCLPSTWSQNHISHSTAFYPALQRLMLLVLPLLCPCSSRPFSSPLGRALGPDETRTLMTVLVVALTDICEGGIKTITSQPPSSASSPHTWTLCATCLRDVGFTTARVLCRIVLPTDVCKPLLLRHTGPQL